MGHPKLRRIKQQWIYKGLLEKIEALGKRIEVKRVHPAFTSTIGMLKYAPQHCLDKDVAGASVVGRRGMGFKEALPGHYQRLLSDEHCVEQAPREP